MTTKFNVGDVVVTLAKCGWAKSGQGVMLAGAIGKVKSVEGDLLTVKFNKKQPFNCEDTKKFRKNFVVPTSEVRLATAEEAASIAKKKKQAETIEFEGEQYRKVDRKAQAGDVVIFRENTYSGLFNGVPYLVKQGKTSLNVKQHTLLYQPDYGRAPETVDVYEKVEAEYVPQEGDIVVITANTNSSRNAVGDIGKVGKITDSYTVAVNVPQRPHTYKANGNYTKFDEFRKATPAEIAQYEQAVADASKPEVKAPVLKAGDYVKFTENQIGIIGGDLYEIIERYEVIGLIDKDGDFRHGGVFGDEYEIIPADDAKWAKIGREPGEYKAGDIVRIVKEGSSGFVKGTLGVVDEDCNDGDDCPRVTAYAADEGEVATYWEKVELVAPVESTLI